MSEKVRIVPSPRIDWCGACQTEHGYDCPQDDLDIYIVNAHCLNCEWKGKRDIPKGIPVAVLESELCPACGCSALRSDGLAKPTE